MASTIEVRRQFRSLLSSEETLVDQMLTVACLVLRADEREIPFAVPDADSEDLPSAEQRERYDQGLIAIARFATIKALIEDPEPEDPETAWVPVAITHFKWLDIKVPGMARFADIHLLSEDGEEMQRELYQDMMANNPPGDDLKTWGEPAA